MARGRLVDELKGVSAGDIDWFDETSTSKTQKITWTERKQRKSESSIVILRNLISLSHGISVFRARFCMEWAAFLHRS